ncbi:MAG: acyl-CoA thioesterase [Phycisphaerales bacterium]|nr:acyl-CoA thioesterase [Phycisphaerales bacterium]
MSIDHPTVARSGTHLCRVRVRYAECDPMGVAHHSSYIPWLEIARTELLRGAGLSYAAMEKAGVFLVVAALEARYRAPARYDDVIEIETRLGRATAARLEHEYELRLVERLGAPAEGLLMHARTTLACVDAHGRVRPMPDNLARPAMPGRGDPAARTDQ